jgi:hypothetical protein
LRLRVVDLFKNGGDGIGELDLGGVEDGVLGFGLEVILGRNQLGDEQRIAGPSVRFGDLDELLFRFGEGDIEDAFAVAEAFEEELEGDGGFAGAGVSFKKVEVTGGKAAVEDVIEADDTGAETRQRGMTVFWGNFGGNRGPWRRDGRRKPGIFGMARHLSALRGKLRRFAESWVKTRNFDAGVRGVVVLLMLRGCSPRDGICGRDF